MKPPAAVCIVSEPEKIRLLADPTRAEILRLLSKYPMTESHLSKQLGLTKAAVGYHLHLLLESGFIYIEKTEVEGHGILQKYYRPTAALFIVDPKNVPEDVQRYFIRTQIEHLRGMLSVLELRHLINEVSSKTLEKLAVDLLRQLKEVGEKHVKEKVVEDAEKLRVKIYAEALAALIKKEEWQALFKRAL